MICLLTCPRFQREPLPGGLRFPFGAVLGNGGLLSRWNGLLTMAASMVRAKFGRRATTIYRPSTRDNMPRCLTANRLRAITTNMVGKVVCSVVPAKHTFSLGLPAPAFAGSRLFDEPSTSLAIPLSTNDRGNPGTVAFIHELRTVVWAVGQPE